jgi:hypothetical protein
MAGERHGRGMLCVNRPLGAFLQHCTGKAMRITYSKCGFVALIVQHAMRTRHFVICVLPDSTVFFLLSHKQHDFRRIKIVTEQNKMCVLIFSTTLSETFLIIRRTERDVVKKCVALHVTYPLFLSDLNETRIFSTDFLKITKNGIS